MTPHITSPGEIVTSIYSCRYDCIEQKMQLGTPDVSSPSGRKIPPSQRKAVNPFASSAMLHYWTMRQKPFDIVVTPIAELFLSRTELTLS